MITIKQEQINTLTTGSEEEFIELLTAHIKEEYPRFEKKYGSKALENMVRGGVKRAKIYNFLNPGDLAAFVSIMFEIAPNFDDQKQIKAVLNDEDTPPDQRIEKLWSPIVPDEAWEEAYQNRHDEAWTLEAQS